LRGEGHSAAGWGIGGSVSIAAEVCSLGQWTAANCATLPTANAGRYATSHCKPLLFSIGAGTIFRLKEQKLVKNNQDNQIQSITLCNAKKYKLCSVQWCLGQNPRSWGIFEKATLQSALCKVTFYSASA